MSLEPVQPAPLGIPGDLSPTGWQPPEDLTIEQWLEIGHTLRWLQTGVQFWIGDHLRVGKERFGERYTQALDETEYSYQALNDMVWVAEHVDFSRRRENLSWSHHREVAALPPAQQTEMLDKAESEGLTRSQLRALIKPKDPEPERVTCSQCGSSVVATAIKQPEKFESTILAMFDESEIADLRTRYPKLDLEYEAQKFTDYWAEGDRKLKRPRSGFRNWLEKAAKFATEGITDTPDQRLERLKELNRQDNA